MPIPDDRLGGERVCAGTRRLKTWFIGNWLGSHSCWWFENRALLRTNVHFCLNNGKMTTIMVTDSLLEAYLNCRTKCYLIARGEIGTKPDYAKWQAKRHDTYKQSALATRPSLLSRREEAAHRLRIPSLNQTEGQIETGIVVRTASVESCLHAVEIVAAKRGEGKPKVLPVRFIDNNRLSRNEKLMAVFDALALSEMLGRKYGGAKIIYGESNSETVVSSPAMAEEVRKLIETISTLIAAPSPPDLILNRHCAECEFQTQCRRRAVEKDDLSLLTNMSAKERKKFNERGIFTVTQLSHTFRPRRRPKSRQHEPEKYQHSLKALSIRAGKIHILGRFELKLDGTPVFFDVEGSPDEGFYYLIGVRVQTESDVVTQRSFWAESRDEEKRIWTEFLSFLKEVANPILLHYGSYDATFLKRMCERHGLPPSTPHSVESAVRQPRNVLSSFLGQVYFPLLSNGLKSVAGFVGARWRIPESTGLQSIMWRSEWETTHSGELKNRLLEYNQDDCEALHILVTELQTLADCSPSRKDIAFADDLKKSGTELGKGIHRTLEGLLKSAHSDYTATKIDLGDGDDTNHEPTKARKLPSKRKLPSGMGRTIRVSRKRTCPKHAGLRLVPRNTQVSCHLLDLVFTKSGCKKTVVHYVGKKAYCPLCDTAYVPTFIKRMRGVVFGRGFQAWAVYQRVVLRMSYRLMAKAALDLFHETVPAQTMMRFVTCISEEYRRTEKTLFETILHSPAIHIDETQLNIGGFNQYVWVITDGSNTAFHLTETREADFIKTLLGEYRGTVVSDFFAGYDSLPCRQQKCIVHLIRDLNEDLWKNPFNSEYEQFVSSVRDLFVPILKDAVRYGPKVRHLRKHRKRVALFYRDTIQGLSPSQELVSKYHKRFIRYRESLFAFLENDGVPWNNNAAERAIRHLAVQRKISGSFTSKGAKLYLRLLGIAQTCRFQSKSFLGFLLSGSTDLASYGKPQRRRCASTGS